MTDLAVSPRSLNFGLIRTNSSETRIVDTGGADADSSTRIIAVHTSNPNITVRRGDSDRSTTADLPGSPGRFAVVVTAPPGSATDLSGTVVFDTSLPHVPHLTMHVYAEAEPVFRVTPGSLFIRADDKLKEPAVAQCLKLASTAAPPSYAPLPQVEIVPNSPSANAFSVGPASGLPGSGDFCIPVRFDRSLAASSFESATIRIKFSGFTYDVPVVAAVAATVFRAPIPQRPGARLLSPPGSRFRLGEGVRPAKLDP